jgi:hypothetical protein
VYKKHIHGFKFLYKEFPPENDNQLIYNNKTQQIACSPYSGLIIAKKGIRT